VTFTGNVQRQEGNSRAGGSGSNVREERHPLRRRPRRLGCRAERPPVGRRTGPGYGIPASRWFLIAVVEFELSLGLWLLADLWPEWTRCAALLCLGLFAAISLYKALSRLTSGGFSERLESTHTDACMLDILVRHTCCSVCFSN